MTPHTHHAWRRTAPSRPHACTSANPWRPQRWVAWGLVAASLVLGACSTPPRDTSAAGSAERLYREAKDDMSAGSFDRAIKSLERVEGLGAGTLLSQQAQLDLAYLYFRTNERTQALATVERFIKLNPSSPALDYAMYLRGVINFNDDLGLLGNLAGQDLSERDQRASRDAFVAFKQLVEQFPASAYAPDAKLRMQYIVNSLANYEVHVARYYFRRGAYVAALNRAQQAVQEFQQAPVAEEALFIIVQSYERLQMPELRDANLRVLRANYPQSRFLTGQATIGQPQGQKPWWRLW
jgi:outer membrane protein assembly factor BamD